MAGPTVNGTSALKPALAEGLTKRAEEKLTTSGAAKVLGNKALNAAPKAAGKALGLGGLMLNSAPMHEQSAMDKRKEYMTDLQSKNLTKNLSDKEKQVVINAIKGKQYGKKITAGDQKKAELKPTETKTSPELKMSPEAEIVDTPPMEVTDTPAGTVGDKPGVKFNFSPVESSKNGLGVKANFQPTPVTGGKPPAGKDPNSEYKNRTDDTDTQSLEIEPKKEGEKASKPTAKNPTGDQWKQDRQPDYHNIINYYRTGGYGDPNSREAKSAMGSAILSEIGKMFSGISNASPVNKGGTYNVSQFDKEREAAMGQDFSFARMDKELETNEALQNYLNELRKNFEKWAIQNKIDFGKDDEKMEALKKFMAAGGNQLESDWTNRLLEAGIDVASSIGMAWLGNKLFKGGLKGARMFF